MSAWDVWAELRSRDDVRLEWADLEGSRGRILRGAGWTTIYIDYRLLRRERTAALAHELVHAERGILFDDATPPGLIESEERAVRREVAERLVPADRLDRAIRHAVRHGHVVTAGAVADWFDVAADVAQEALQLAEERARRRHPTASTAFRRHRGTAA